MRVRGGCKRKVVESATSPTSSLLAPLLPWIQEEVQVVAASHLVQVIVLVLHGMKCKFFCTLIPVLQQKDTAQTHVKLHFMPRSTSTHRVQVL